MPPVPQGVHSLPLLMMTKSDVLQPWGRILEKANSAQRMPDLTAPKCNYTGGATATGAFKNLLEPGYEVFVVVGRPGEPQPLFTTSKSSSVNADPTDGVSVERYTTTDFISWSGPVSVLFLENGSGKPKNENDGSIWTVKSMARNEQSGGYLCFSYHYTVALCYVSACSNDNNGVNLQANICWQHPTVRVCTHSHRNPRQQVCCRVCVCVCVCVCASV